jgi:hypothetical protein
MVSPEISHVEILACARSRFAERRASTASHGMNSARYNLSRPALAANYSWSSLGSASTRQPHERSRVKSGMIRPLPLPDLKAVLAVGADEAFNPIDAGLLHPDPVVFKADVSDTGQRQKECRVSAMRWAVLVGPIFDDESVDSGTVCGGRT